MVKLGALLAIIAISPQFSIDLQLIGGVIILQTLPAVAIGLFTRWFHAKALIAGWVVGTATGVWTLYLIPARAFADDGTVTIVREHFGGSAFALSNLGFDSTTTVYAGFVAVGANLVVAAAATLLLRGRVADGVDATSPADYTAERGDAAVKPLPDVAAST